MTEIVFSKKLDLIFAIGFDDRINFSEKVI